MGKRTFSIGISVVELIYEELCYSCHECGTSLSEGSFAIGVTVDTRRFFIEHNPPLSCCNKAWFAPLLYKDRASAERKRDEVIAIVKSGDDLNRLILGEVTGELDQIVTN